MNATMPVEGFKLQVGVRQRRFREVVPAVVPAPFPGEDALDEGLGAELPHRRHHPWRIPTTRRARGEPLLGRQLPRVRPQAITRMAAVPWATPEWSTRIRPNAPLGLLPSG